MAQNNARTWKFLGVAAIAVVVVLVLVNVGQRSTYDITDTGNPSIGSGDLTVYLFEDYECSHCADLNAGVDRPALDHLMETWVDTGKITVVFKHVAIVSGTSYDAARASRCVADLTDEDGWLAWDHLVYERQVNSGYAFQASVQNLEPLTREWGGVDMDLYRDCVKADEELDAITDQNKDDFANAGVRGTPSIVVGNQVLSPKATSDVDAAIQAALDAMAQESDNGTA